MSPSLDMQYEPVLRAFRVCILASSLLASIGAVSPTKAPVARGQAVVPRFKAVAFDYFVPFNPDSVIVEAERLFPGRGRELTNLWRMRQFEYSWLRSITDRYVDFFAVTEDGLVFTANAMNLKLTPDGKRKLLDAYLHLTPWPDTVAALRSLKESGSRIIAISNFTPATTSIRVRWPALKRPMPVREKFAPSRSPRTMCLANISRPI